MTNICSLDGCSKEGIYSLYNRHNENFWFCTKKHMHQFVDERQIEDKKEDDNMKKELDQEQLWPIVVDALENMYDLDQQSIERNTLEDEIRFASSYIKGWIDAKEDATNDQINLELLHKLVRKFVLEKLHDTIGYCLEFNDDPTSFRDWPIVKGGY